MTHNNLWLMTLFLNNPIPFSSSGTKLMSILSKKPCKCNAVPHEPNLTLYKAEEFEFLKFNHPKPLHCFPQHLGETTAEELPFGHASEPYTMLLFSRYLVCTMCLHIVGRTLDHNPNRCPTPLHDPHIYQL